MSTGVILQCVVVAMVFTAFLDEALSIPLCSVDTNDLENCRAAVTGDQPPPPDNGCCGVIRRSDLSCLCSFKSYLPLLGIDPAKAIALGAKCSITNTPPACNA